mmetsp:Transcript_23556/g.40208  ORF Transcript_23556/g.40208 Transcript_23556/m.40208 type:complete len:267 (+) Transcript_23556:145-945(+)
MMEHQQNCALKSAPSKVFGSKDGKWLRHRDLFQQVIEPVILLGKDVRLHEVPQIILRLGLNITEYTLKLPVWPIHPIQHSTQLCKIAGISIFFNSESSKKDINGFDAAPVFAHLLDFFVGSVDVCIPLWVAFSRKGEYQSNLMVGTPILAQRHCFPVCKRRDQLLRPAICKGTNNRERYLVARTAGSGSPPLCTDGFSQAAGGMCLSIDLEWVFVGNEDSRKFIPRKFPRIDVGGWSLVEEDHHHGQPSEQEEELIRKVSHLTFNS